MLVFSSRTAAATDDDKDRFRFNVSLLKARSRCGRDITEISPRFSGDPTHQALKLMIADGMYNRGYILADADADQCAAFDEATSAENAGARSLETRLLDVLHRSEPQVRPATGGRTSVRTSSKRALENVSELSQFYTKSTEADAIVVEAKREICLIMCARSRRDRAEARSALSNPLSYQEAAVRHVHEPPADGARWRVPSSLPRARRAGDVARDREVRATWTTTIYHECGAPRAEPGRMR